jgi:hypothetical protein
VDSTAGFDTFINVVERNTTLLEDVTIYSVTKQWDLKLPNIFVATFEIQGISSFNFHNTSDGTAANGYTLLFNGTSLKINYDNAELATATIPNLDSTYGKVYVTFEKKYITVTINGTRYLTYEDTQRTLADGGKFINFFNTSGAFKNLKIVAGNWISDGTSNVVLMGGNLGIGTDTPEDTLHVNGGIRFGGHIIPTTNATFDVGSADKKVRDMYVDDNSLWIGDEMKIAFENGKMKFKRRKLNKVPKVVTDLAIAHSVRGVTDAATTGGDAVTYLKAHFPSDGIESLADLKLQHWKAYTKSIDPTKAISDIFVDNDEDYEAVTASEAFVEVGSDIYSAHNISIGKTTAPTSALDVAGTVTATAAIFSGDVAVNTNTLFVNATTSNVGIGTVTPGYTLDVAGDINLSGTFNQNGAPFASSPWTTTGTDLSYTTGSISGDGSGLTTLNASNISSGTVAAARIPTLNQNTTGSAATLTTPRTIGGVSFNGSAAINLPGVNTPGNQNTTGSAGSATTAGSVSTSVTPGSYLTGSAYNGSTARTFAVDATTAATASKIVARDSSGHIFANYLNMSHGASARNSDTVFYSSTDDYIRKNTAAGMRSSLGVAALAGSTSQNFSASTLTTNTRLTLSSTASIRQSSTSPWSGDPGSGVGKIEYHSNRWYIVAGSNSTELLQVRRDGSNKFTIDNNGSISLGTVPAARISGTVSSATTAGACSGNSATATTAGSVSTSVTPGSYLTGSAYNGSTARTFAVDATTAATASKIVARNSSGHIYGNYIHGAYMNMSHGASARNSDTVFYSSTDNYIRKNTAAGMRSSLGLKNSATTTATDADTASTIVMRNGSGDMFARLFRSDYGNQSDCGAGIAFRNSTSDNYIRFCSNMGNVRSRIGCYGNGSNITRTSHSNGYMVGSYNSVGGNDAKTNPIYTIGSNYQPSDTSLSNMYGIGYSHSNFTSILTGGWGMYVAADGDARIGLNGSNGNIKCTGYITAGGNVTAYSDIRGKENIKRIENPLERIEKMNGYIYNKKEEPTKKYTGVVAQELLEVLPEVVEGNEKDGYAVAYGNFAGIFIEAIKELKAQLQVEKSRNDRLEALMTTFNSRLDNVN